MEEKKAIYTATNTYSILNKITHKTKNIWLVCHGMGYLSKYFIRYFKELDSTENYIIAPQAPNKYYQGPDFKHVGASWLTRVDTAMETTNVMNYMNKVAELEELSKHTNKRFICMGYSQGVSIMMRWLKQTTLVPNDLILHSGGIPTELEPKDLVALAETRTYLVYGDQDEYLTEDRITTEKEKAQHLFPTGLSIHEFSGKHEVNTRFIQALVN
ncbi:esterase [Gangjinia marincola]|uniref:Esterase n=1 Tax=Gangjinia marincola TaxID=578463 RepID=A0ABN1MFH6_9FLAO